MSTAPIFPPDQPERHLHVVEEPGSWSEKPMADVAAEQAVLGMMMTSTRSVDAVAEILASRDFHEPHHATLYATVICLWAGNNPTDPIAVTRALSEMGELVRVGGAPYLHTLTRKVPTTAGTADYYARIVKDWAQRRRVREAGLRIVQTSQQLDKAVDEVVDQAQHAIHEATVGTNPGTLASFADFRDEEINHLEAVMNGNIPRGLSTGLGALDDVIGGFLPGQLVIPAGRPGAGKALALDTPLVTPEGWTTMGDVEVGDQLIGADGKPTRVVAATNVMPDRPCYEVEFSDGTVIVADAEHQWRTTTRAIRRQRAAVRTSWHWAQEDREHVRRLCQEVTASPDTLVSLGDAVILAGETFRKSLQRAGAVTGHAGCVTREYTRAGKPWVRMLPAYSRQELFSALLQRVERPVNAASIASHPDVVTTEQIAASVRYPTDGRANHAVDNCRPLDLPERDLPVPPYTLGAWLGDGHSRGAQITTADPEMLTYIEADGFVTVRRQTGIAYTIAVPELPPLPRRSCVVCGVAFQPKSAKVKSCGPSCGGKSRFVAAPLPEPTCADCGVVVSSGGNGSSRCQPCRRRHGSLVGSLRALEVWGNKHIPAAYLRASDAQRRALLAGLLDTDGTVAPAGAVQFCSTSPQLAVGVRELIVSLGYRCAMTTKAVRGRTAESSTAYLLSFSTMDEVFRLGRKRMAHKERSRTTSTARTGLRYITAVRAIPSVPVRCVEVDNADHMYLAGRSMIPTHNSCLGAGFAIAAARRGKPALIFSLEMSRRELTWRILSSVGSINLSAFTSGRMTPAEFDKAKVTAKQVAEWPLLIDDKSNTVMDIRSAARRFRQRHGALSLVFVDYLQRMRATQKFDRRDLEVGRHASELKTLAQELETTMVVPSQLNRESEKRGDKRPQLSDMRDSGEVEQEADVVILLHREDYYDKESARAGEADLIVAKQRNGPTDTVSVAAQLHQSRFVDFGMRDEPGY